jgi:chorismate mutase
MTKGPVAPASLETLREEIDGIDGEIHRLIQRRAEIVATLGEIKKAQGGGNAMRPGREAQILRRLATAHKGAFPLAALFGVWRTMMTAFLRMQHPIEVRVVAGADSLDVWDAARIHFGAETPMQATTTAEALKAAAGSDRVLAALPAPSAQNDWWLSLDQQGLKVLALLPFFDYASPSEAVFIVAPADPEPSGDDISWLRLDGRVEDLDRTIADARTKAGLELSLVAAYNPADRDSREQRLIAVDGYLAPSEDAFGKLQSLAMSHDVPVQYVGCFARPLN